jgi:hypothetical protein
VVYKWRLAEVKLTTQRTDPDLVRQITILVAIIGSIVINTISNFFPPDGVDMATLSDRLFTSVQILPANYAFAIWAPIYLGLIAFGIYQAQPAQSDNSSLQRGGYLLVFACIAQCAWIYLFLARLFPLSVVAMFGILLPLIVLYQRLEIGQRHVSPAEQWFIQIPISIYLGWITVAIVVNASLALYSIDWDGWGIAPAIWAVIMMLVSGAITTQVTIKHHDTAYLLVIVWALIAIGIRHLDTPLITVTAAVTAIFLILFNLEVAPKPFSYR